MKQLDNLSDAAYQTIRNVLDDGSIVTFNFAYRPATQRWTVDVAWGTRTFHNLNLVVGPNILRTWRRLIPFGLAVTSLDGVDPFNIEDFSSGRVTVYVLNQDDVAYVEDTVVAGAS
jgi:hypothetical protein